MDENYIGVAMGMDVSDLKAGISEANKQIQLANSEFKAASSGMDDWTKSTEGITAKVKQLDSVLQMQKSKLAGLTAEYEKVAAEQGEGSEAARKLKVQINNQQAVVNKTQKEFDNYSETLEQAEAGTIDLNSVTLRGGKAYDSMKRSQKQTEETTEELTDAIRELKEETGEASDEAEESAGAWGAFGKVAGGIGKGLLAVGAAAAGAVTGFLALAESTRETRENMAKLETGFTTAGHSAEDASETYKDLYAVLGDEGQATEAAAHLALLANNQEDLTKWTDIATGVYATFGDSLPIENLTEAANETAKTGKITGGLADALNWAGVSEEEFQAKLDAATSEQERQALITDTLNGLYAEQSAQFKELNGDIMSAREADAALAETMAELGAIAEPIMTTLKVLAVDLLNSIKPFVELLGTGLQGVLEGNAGAAETMAQGLSGIIGSLVGTISDMLPTVLSVFSQLVPMLLIALSEQLPTIVEAIATFLPQIIETLLGMLPTLIETVIELVLQIITALSGMLPQIVNAIMAILPVLISRLIAAIPQLIQAAVTLLMAIVQALPTIINALIAALPSVITTIINALIQSIPLLLDAAIQLLDAIIQAIPTIVQALITNLPQIIDTIITGVLDAVPLLLDAAITLFFAILDALPVLLGDLARALPEIAATIISALSKAVPDVLSKAGEVFGEILTAAGNLIKDLPSKMGEIITAIVNGLNDGISKIKQVGSDIITGLWNGISDMAGWIADKIQGFGEGVLSGIKSFFGIASPSKLMRKEVGQWIGKGIGVGILDSIPAVKKNVDKFSNFVSDNIGNIKAGLSLDSDLAYAGATGGRGRTGKNGNGGYTVVNAGMTVNYNGNLSRKQLKKIETDHYKSVKSKLKQEGAIK